ncbi:MAG TPA: hypothetical protein VLJ59_07670 [Mycobacteriales bacterium]|nr:hypothetical protein [Mycobacteriales bacterium]
MRLSHKLIVSTIIAATTVGVGSAAFASSSGTGLAAFASGGQPAVAAPYRPISADAPYDNLLRNVTCAVWPKVTPAAHTDYGHLPRWAHGPNSTVILREDRVDLHRVYSSQGCYTNVNPMIRSYRLAPNAAIRVLGANYNRMTGRHPSENPARRYAVTRQQFLNSFNTKKDSYQHYLRYASVYKLTFDRSRQVVGVTEVNASWRYGTCGC